MGNPEEIGKDPASGDAAGDVAPVSVIIITLNEEQNIRDCLDSLMRLDYPAEKYEIIVVDASTDATPDIAATYRRVKVVRSGKGFSRQKNAGVRASRFDLLAFTDADCLIPPAWLRTITRAFRDPRLAAAGGSAYPPRGTSGFELWSACVGHPAGGAIGLEANVAPGAEGIDFVPGCNSVYRRGALEDVGGFNPDFEDGGEDIDVSRRLRAKGYFLDYVLDLFVYHKPRPTLRAYFRWNVGVGATKYSLRRPALGRLLLEAGSPLWPAAFLGGLVALPGFPWSHLVAVVAAWAAMLLGLLVGTRPYPLLVKRRRRIGISLVTVLTVVPFLIAVRQAGINLGQLRKRRKEKIAGR
ncbi:MAG: glycosyltransferase [Candidatus Aminicenantes bacterium]|nr:glycosyltransferase [Candidatus Aminicenantes bacterium]